jgi:carbamoyl-phosphate synthase large subunit
MKRCKVMVTGVGGASGMGTVKSLLKVKNITVVAADMNPLAAPLYWAHEKTLLPPANRENYIDKLIEVIKQREVDVVIPNTSEEMFPIAIQKENIEKYAKLMISRPDSIKMANDKLEAYHTLSNSGIPAVKTKLVKNEVDLAEAIAEFSFPVVIKPRISRGGRGLFVCEDLADASSYFHKLKKILPFSDMFFRSKAATQIICQEYLSGIEYDINVLLGKQANVVACVPMKVKRWDVHHQLREIVTEHNNEIEQLTVNATIALDLIGPIDVEIRHNSEGKPKILEINPRTGGDVELATAAGCNIPYLTIKLSLGEDVEYTDFSEDVFLTRFIAFQTMKKDEIPTIN